MGQKLEASGAPSPNAWVSSKGSEEVNLEGRSVTWAWEVDDVSVQPRPGNGSKKHQFFCVPYISSLGGGQKSGSPQYPPISGAKLSSSLPGETRIATLQCAGFWCVLGRVSSPYSPFGLLPETRGIPLHQGMAPVLPKLVTCATP